MDQNKWSRAIIVGASSGIGEALARQLALEGCRVALLARRKSELERVASEINSVHANRAVIFPHDVTDVEEVAGLFADIVEELNGLDIIIYAAGIMPRVKPNEYNLFLDTSTVATNFTGAVAWLNQAALRFGRTKSGTIVGISSVAGDRGRRGFPVYSASKTAMNTYLESLRNRIERSGATVITVKPGPVSTPMTEGLKMPLMISADQAAREILGGAKRGERNLYVPIQWKYIMAVVRLIPSAIFKYMNF